MEKMICPKCKAVSYTASPWVVSKCAYCDYCYGRLDNNNRLKQKMEGCCKK